jgi:hypothetical protein
MTGIRSSVTEAILVHTTPDLPLELADLIASYLVDELYREARRTKDEITCAEIARRHTVTKESMIETPYGVRRLVRSTLFGFLHSVDDAPAVRTICARHGVLVTAWYRDGVRHRDGGPAVIARHFDIRFNGESTTHWFNESLEYWTEDFHVCTETGPTQQWNGPGQ